MTKTGGGGAGEMKKGGGGETKKMYASGVNGYLMKEGRRFRMKERRFFTLKGGMLSCQKEMVCAFCVLVVGWKRIRID